MPLGLVSLVVDRGVGRSAVDLTTARSCCEVCAPRALIHRDARMPRCVTPRPVTVKNSRRMEHSATPGAAPLPRLAAANRTGGAVFRGGAPSPSDGGLPIWRGLASGGGVRSYLWMISGSHDGSANSSPYRSAISSLASVGGGPDATLGQLSEEPLEATRADDLDHPGRDVARVPHGMHLTARLGDVAASAEHDLTVAGPEADLPSVTIEYSSSR